MENYQIKAACEEIRNGRSFIILVHPNPDADALGSALALARAIKRLGKEALVISQDEIPESCEFIPEVETVIRSTERRDFDVGIACDIQEPFRVGISKEPLYSTNALIVIDHHVSPFSSESSASDNPMTAGTDESAKSLPDYDGKRLLVLDSSAAATAELIVELLEELGVDLDNIIAEQLMAAMVGDTGGFRFPNVTPRTFEVAAKLARHGASASKAARHIYETRSFVSTTMLGRVLASLESDKDGCIFWGIVRREDYQNLGAVDSDTEGIVNFIRMIKGARAAILFREIEEKSVRISLRSQVGVDVRKVAAAFGGGGHERAAGCTINRPLDEAVRLVIDEVRKWTEC